jgi:2-keto-4-pentenoate hydratase/2-oxohepta-3-ene-1,7-dioic acid hydratase in catechol pathway
MPPLPRPGKIVCVGRNYREHARELGNEVPPEPLLFLKPPSSVVDDGAAVVLPRASTQVEHEAEIGVVVGARLRHASEDEARAAVRALVALNDVTARDLQQRHGQFFKGKSLDGFCPMGPTVVTADEFGDPQAKRLTCRVNGVVKQDGSTGDMIFPVRAIVEWLSKGMTIEAGDIIATGTPEGVGMGRTPQEFLHDGDLLETEVQDIGVMRNRIVG